jgi:altronate hydrolase
MAANKTLKIHPSDDVMVALETLPEGTPVHQAGADVVLTQQVPAKHKFALKSFGPGDPVHMYGTLVGRAAEPIRAGELLTTQNIRHAASDFAAPRHDYAWQAPDVARWRDTTFLGYHRARGRVGTANHWLVVPMVFCENRNIQAIKDALEHELGYGRDTRYRALARRLVTRYRERAPAEELLALALEDEDAGGARQVFPNVDGVKFLMHQSGCGESRRDSETLCALLAAYINHPNVAGATVLSLGCQNAQVRLLEEALLRQNPAFDKPLHVFEQQALGSEETLVSEAIKRTFVGLMQADACERAPAPLSALTLGVECGGSDGFSGISANPAVGHTADLLVALGGSVVLSEFPELCGVEQELIDRCVDTPTAERFIEIQRAYAARAEADGGGFDMNPSPGNIRDGLLTDAMKSAGAAKKGGTSPIVDVLDYTEPLRKHGLNLLCTPGNDVESTTGLAGSGATLILFTTGLGTPTGNPVTPVIKVSSNSQLARRMPDIIDIDAGAVITGEETIEEVGARMLDYCIRVASGEAAPKAVQLGQDDFIPWKRGISL